MKKVTCFTALCAALVLTLVISACGSVVQEISGDAAEAINGSYNGATATAQEVGGSGDDEGVEAEELSLQGEDAEGEAEEAVDRYNGALTLDVIAEDAASYVGGRRRIVGYVAESATMPFALENASGTFLIQVDYRGNEALPELGEKIIIEGQFVENRPCCGGGFTLMTFAFTLVEE
jgi:hypothetical protein